ncbi:tetratricopeptide repeat protein [Natronospira bacteriovora]|uniref:Tetratricopeptide repeat protein n=1 Tax=Natronospira bacteriovora TaxID=3069753 RepID=A0ABU0W634_9GAMM|nr:hypothetical protein [Natronospira sp. AB-CW4]MDQ2069466.1 hypothetical protein [Natronospira sp. AB-CW4]
MKADRFNVSEKRRPSLFVGALVTGLLLLFLAGPVLAQGLMTQQTYNRLERIHDLMDEDEFEEALNRLGTARERAQNDHERAIIAQLAGHLHIMLENYREALEEFERSVEFENGLPEDPLLNTISNIAQLHIQFENYEKTLDYVNRYLRIVENSDEKEDAPSRIYVIGAQANMSLDNMRAALPFITRAIELEDEPRESYYRVKRGIEFELEDYRAARGTLESMIGYWPDNMEYWFQLFSLNVELEEEERGLSVLKLAHRKGLFERETHYVNLYRMYMLQESPFEAGQVLQEGLDNGTVEHKVQHIEMLSRAWIQAQEHDRAVEVLNVLAEMKDTGDPELTIAQIAQERAHWEDAYSAAMRAYEKGGLDEPGRALLLAGRAAAEMKDYDEALAAFEAATNYEDARNQARQWLSYIEEERAIMSNR